MQLAQLVHQVLCVLAVLTALALVVLAGAAELQSPSAPPARSAAPSGPAASAQIERQRANVEKHDDALARVEFAGFTLVSIGVLMLFAAYAGGAPVSFRNLSGAFLTLAATQTLLFELQDPLPAIAALHVVVAAVALGAAVRAVARHALLPAPWEMRLPSDAAVPV